MVACLGDVPGVISTPAKSHVFSTFHVLLPTSLWLDADLVWSIGEKMLQDIESTYLLIYSMFLGSVVEFWEPSSTDDR